MRVAYLQGAPSGHANACLRALAATGTDLFITLPPTLRDAPYDTASVGAAVVHEMSSFDRNRRLESDLAAFEPDVVLIVSWHQPAYRACARRARQAVRVLCMDNQWLATPKQRLGVAARAVYIQPYFDAAFLPGRRQREFARRLGFADDRIFEGFYSADTDAFSSTGRLDASDRAAFVYAGRLSAEKGIGHLVAAYRAYRDAVTDPIDLVVAGTGDEETLLKDVPGVRLLGFVQPHELPAVFTTARFLVLPSNFEPWGVVVHEAVASGLGVVCSNRVGAADYLVDNGRNGHVVEPDDAAALTGALRWAHELTAGELEAVRRRSIELAELYSPGRWARTVLEIGERLRHGTVASTTS